MVPKNETSIKIKWIIQMKQCGGQSQAITIPEVHTDVPTISTYIPNTVTTASCIATLANMWYAFICHCNIAMYEIYTLIVYVTVSVKTLHVRIFYTVSQK